jgi:hypothetical protein
MGRPCIESAAKRLGHALTRTRVELSAFFTAHILYVTQSPVLGPFCKLLTLFTFCVVDTSGEFDATRAQVRAMGSAWV